MLYSALFDVYENGAAFRTIQKEFLVSDELSNEQAAGQALNHMKHFALQHGSDHPGEAAILRSIYRMPKGEVPVPVYPEENNG